MIQKPKQASFPQDNIDDRILSDGVVLLRPFDQADAAVHVAGDDADSIKWLNDGHASTLASTRKWIERNQAAWQNNGPVYNFAIRQVEGDVLSGMIEANTDIQRLEGLTTGDVNISYSLYPTARGKGYVARSLVLVEDFLRSRGFKRACIRIDPENTASLKVPERGGYHQAGIIRTKTGEELMLFIKGLC